MRTTTTSIGLEWNASTDNVGVAGYNVYLTGIKVWSPIGTSYTYLGLTCGTTYTVAPRMPDSAFQCAYLRGVVTLAGPVTLRMSERSRPSVRIRVEIVDETGAPARTVQLMPVWSGHGNSPAG